MSNKDRYEALLKRNQQASPDLVKATAEAIEERRAAGRSMHRYSLAPPFSTALRPTTVLPYQ